MTTPRTSAGAPAAAVTERGRPNVLQRLWAGLRFRDALLVSMLPLAALTFLYGAAARDYAHAREYDDYFSKARSIQSLFSARVDGVRSLPRGLQLRESLSPEDTAPGIVQLSLPAVRWDSMEIDRENEWGAWLDADLKYGKSAIKVRVRKRGDNSVHWLTEKRSMTVRTPRDDFFKRFRQFGLSGKDVVPSFLANRMSQEYGLLAPSTDIVAVYLNNRFYGTFRFVEVVDESFLRPFDRMPGNIFRGDAAERGSYYKGQNRNLFENLVPWDRASANDRVTSAGTGQLRLLLQDIAGTTFADHERLMRRVYRGEFARLLSYLLLAGDPYHDDAVHNQLIYEDPSTQLLHPIPWDTRLMDLAVPQQPVNPWYQAMMRDPFVVDSAVADLASRLKDDAFLARLDSIVRGVEHRYANYLAYDRLRGALIPDVGTGDEAMALIRRNARLLRQRLSDDTVAINATPAAGVTIVDLETRGWVGAELQGFTTTAAPAGAVTVRLDRNLNGVLDEADPAVATSVTRDAGGAAQLQLATPVVLYSGWDATGPEIRRGHVPYRLFVTGLPSATTLAPRLTNRVTGAPAAGVSWEAGGAVREGTGWHPWRFAESRGSVHRLAGDVRLEQTLVIAAKDTLVIEPGTTIRLAPDQSLVSYGRVLALGTRERPIRVLPLTEGVPWGTFSIQGHGADSSIFQFVEVAQGGGAIVNRVEYIGMFNIHRADGVVVEHSIFRDNLRSDDTFHALHTRFYLRHSSVIRGNSDAIDLDIASGELIDNTIVDAGGDGIDLMTSTPRIIGNRVSGSGDKGISIGEASTPFVFNNDIFKCNIGIEVKDRSDPILLHNRVVDNKTGLRERRKNWRYGGGGWATVAQTIFSGNRTPRVRDEFSRLTLAGVAGLDSAGSAVVVEPSDLAWLYRMEGIAVPPGASPGLVAGWREVAPTSPVDVQSFTDDFADVSGGWVASGGMTRLEKRRDALVLEVSRHAGRAARAVRWSLPAGGSLVLELAGRDAGSSRAIVHGDGATADVQRDFTLGSDPATAHFVTVALPPGTYRGVALDLAPVPGLTEVDPNSGLTIPRGARLNLRGYRVIPASPTTPPRPTPRPSR
ncbi:MAG: right-handed parallel beta-helix repeat-containing protein [Gemmatimonadaceae bacterium]|nr:right-handed parallel beta-helix repeat-containing protein [Gemmatimonadaceae bacterium]